MIVNAYLQLFRMGNAVMGAIGVLVATFMAVGTGMFDQIINLILCVLVVFSFICGGNALNDYIDHEIDKTAHPERPVPSGRLSRKNAYYAGILMMVLAVVLSLFTKDLESIVIVIVASVLMICYELFLKQRGFVGNFTIAVLTGMMFLLGGAVVGKMESNIIVALMAMLVSIGREISKDIEDMDSDEGRKTLPMSIGVKNSSILAAIFFVAGPVLSILPLVQHTYGILYATVLVADLLFVFCAVKVFSDPHKAQKMAKVGMIVALLAFILGAATMGL